MIVITDARESAVVGVDAAAARVASRARVAERVAVGKRIAVICEAGARLGCRSLGGVLELHRSLDLGQFCLSGTSDADTGVTYESGATPSRA